MPFEHDKLTKLCDEYLGSQSSLRVVEGRGGLGRQMPPALGRNKTYRVLRGQVHALCSSGEEVQLGMDVSIDHRLPNASKFPSQPFLVLTWPMNETKNNQRNQPGKEDSISSPINWEGDSSHLSNAGFCQGICSTQTLGSPTTTGPA